MRCSPHVSATRCQERHPPGWTVAAVRSYRGAAVLPGGTVRGGKVPVSFRMQRAVKNPFTGQFAGLWHADAACSEKVPAVAMD
jgi:hypothetical protein